MAKSTEKVLPVIWNALEKRELCFYVFLSSNLLQSGDLVTFQKLDSDGKGYALGPSGMFSTCDVTFELGWMIPGGEMGIQPGYTAFQLNPLPRIDI